MADAVPAALRQADVNISKCATRAAQLESVKPIISYWCEYWVVNQILAKDLHNADPEVLAYTTRLMDKLEQTKREYADEEAVTDDMAGQAYVEQFAQETLDRAQKVVNANKVTQQTAGTFDAAATFFNLVNIWGPPSPENLQKIKYAKWNATRIFKAIKDGSNPNDSNPKKEELPPPQATLDPNDPEVQMLGLAGNSATGGPKPVSVEDVPDSDLRRDSAGVSLPHSPVSGIHPVSGPKAPRLPDIPASAPGITQLGTPPPVQPGYFDEHSMPRMPSPMSPPAHDPVHYHPTDAPGPVQPWAPTPSPPALQSAFAPPPAAFSPPPAVQQGFTSPPPSVPAFSPPPTQFQPPPAPMPGPPTFAPSPQPTAAVAPPPMGMGATPSPNFMNSTPLAGFARPAIPPPTAPIPMHNYRATPPAPQPTPQQSGFRTDDHSMAEAQKHAKWAISALNFDDVPTAVRELRTALQALGAL